VAEEELCVDIPIAVTFDGRRRFEGEYRVCAGDSISDVASRVAQDIAQAWARRMKVTDVEAVERITEGVEDVLDIYLTGALYEVYGGLLDALEQCIPGITAFFGARGSDGYSEKGRSVFVDIDISGTCEYLEKVVAVIGELVAPRIAIPAVPEAKLRLAEDRLTAQLPEDAKSYVKMLEQLRSPYETLWDLLKKLVGGRFWWTIYRTRNE